MKDTPEEIEEKKVEAILETLTEPLHRIAKALEEQNVFLKKYYEKEVGELVKDVD